MGSLIQYHDIVVQRLIQVWLREEWQWLTETEKGVLAEYDQELRELLEHVDRVRLRRNRILTRAKLRGRRAKAYVASGEGSPAGLVDMADIGA